MVTGHVNYLLTILVNYRIVVVLMKSPDYREKYGT